MGKAALYAAEADDDVLAGLDACRRLARVLVGKGADVLVGKLVAHGIGHLIDEPDDDARMSAVLLFDGLTLLALAEQEVVVLREAVDAVLWMIAHVLCQTCLTQLQHFGVRQTELPVAAVALAVAQAEVLGMRLEELFRWDEMPHRVSSPVSLDVAVCVGVGAPFHVLASMGAPFGHVGSDEVVAVAIADEWTFGVVEPRQFPAFELWHDGTFRREPVDAKLALEEGEDAVHRAALRTSPDEQVPSDSLVGEALVVGFRLLGSGSELQSGIVAHDDARLCIHVVSDGQAGAAYLFDVLLQLFGCGLFRSGGTG